MLFVFAALLLGAVTSPPPGDDDAPRSRRPLVTAPARSEDDDNQPKSTANARAQVESDDDEEGNVQPSSMIIVAARRLDTARTEIDQSLGSTVYSLTNEVIENRPGGETGSISDILNQAPGVTLSSQGLTIRGSSANQVRINNVIIPEAIADPADQLSSRLAETTRLINGTLPAQYGFAPAGVISVTTKNGLYQHGGQLEYFGGSDGMIEPAVEWAGSLAATSLFASGDLEHSSSGVADLQGNAAHDRRTEIGGLGFADHLIDQSDRLSLIFGGSRDHQAIGATSIGPGTELDSDGYAVGTFQHSDDRLTVQASLFAGAASSEFRFDSASHERRSAFGTQIDASETIGMSHRLRIGLLATHSTASELDYQEGSSAATRTSLAAYLEDEWKLAPSLTFNPGARVEWLRGLGSIAILEPRASLVWASNGGLAAHIGYSRFASAPPIGELGAGAALPNERDDYFDAGFEDKLGRLTLGADAYWRSAQYYLAEHQSAGSAVPTAFAFRNARIDGVELSATYSDRATSAWANVALARARARAIIGGNGLFAPATIAAASINDVPLGSDRPVTISGGLLQHLGKFSLSADMLVSSGSVETRNIADPNGSRDKAYALFGLAAVCHLTIAGKPADLRLDFTNLTNVRYQSADASALEGGWTRRGRGRAVTIGIEQGF